MKEKTWGNDASSAFALNLNPEQLQKVTLYSTNKALNRTDGSTAGIDCVTSFRHNELNFVYVGDDGFLSSIIPFDASATAYPFSIDRNNKPAPKTFDGGYPAYNSLFFANIFSWALERATDFGVNSDKYE